MNIGYGTIHGVIHWDVEENVRDAPWPGGTDSVGNTILQDSRARIINHSGAFLECLSENRRGPAASAVRLTVFG